MPIPAPAGNVLRSTGGVAAEEFPGVHDARIHAAEYFGSTGTMSLELVWPIVSREMKPDSTAIREAARQRFGWLS